MLRGPATFRQRDVRAAIKAVEAAGHQVAQVEISPDGKIVVILMQPAESDAASTNEWDTVLAGPVAVRSRVS
jgi:hypothetical protein